MHFDIFVLQIKNVEKFLSAHIFCQSVLVIRQIIKKVFTTFFGGRIPSIMTDTLSKEMSCHSTFYCSIPLPHIFRFPINI